MRIRSERATAEPVSGSRRGPTAGLKAAGPIVYPQGDRLEREADLAAEAAMDGRDHRPTPLAERASQPQLSTAVLGKVDAALAAPGAPLGTGLSRYFGDRYGHDFARVRIHADAAAADSARALGAKAYATGTHVVLGAQAAREASGGTPSRLLAHELAHVAQMGAVSPADSARMPIMRQPEETSPNPYFRAINEGRRRAEEEQENFRQARLMYSLKGEYIFRHLFAPIEIRTGQRIPRNERYDMMLSAQDVDPWRIDFAATDVTLDEDLMSREELSLERKARAKFWQDRYNACGGGVSGAKCRRQIWDMAAPSTIKERNEASRRAADMSVVTGDFFTAATYHLLHTAGVSHDKAVSAARMTGGLIDVKMAYRTARGAREVQSSTNPAKAPSDAAHPGTAGGVPSPPAHVGKPSPPAPSAETRPDPPRNRAPTADELAQTQPGPAARPDLAQTQPGPTARPDLARTQPAQPPELARTQPLRTARPEELADTQPAQAVRPARPVTQTQDTAPPPAKPARQPIPDIRELMLKAPYPNASFRNDPVPVETALARLAVDRRSVVTSLSQEFHQFTWEKTFGHLSPAPLAFTHGNYIYLNLYALSPGQFAQVQAIVGGGSR